MIPRTKPAHQRVNIHVSCKGMRVAIDMYVWLHEFALRHARAVVLANDPSGVLDDVLRRAAYLVRCGITPVFVFDGAPAAAKGGTVEARAKRRAASYARFEALDIEDVAATESALRGAISIKWEMVTAVIDALRL